MNLGHPLTIMFLSSLLRAIETYQSILSKNFTEEFTSKQLQVFIESDSPFLLESHLHHRILFQQA